MATSKKQPQGVTATQHWNRLARVDKSKAKKPTRIPPPPRAISPQHHPGAQREGALQIAGVEYATSLDGAHWVIRRRAPGKKIKDWPIVEHCQTVTMSEIEHRVAVLNRGKPTRAENQSWGILTKARARAKPGSRLAVKSSDPEKLSVTEWVEYLVGDPVTSIKLIAYVGAKRRTGRSLNIDTLKSLMKEAGGKLSQCVNAATHKAVLKQLERKFEILRSDEGEIHKYSTADF